VTTRSGALRRRRKPSLATRLRIFWVFIVLIVGALSYSVFAFITWPALRVHAISVDIDGLAVTKRDVLDAARIEADRNVWLLDTGKIARRIEAIPYVEAASVRRIPPADIAIAVSEREPAACVRAGSALVTIDRTRRILQTGCARPSALEISVPAAVVGAPGSMARAPDVATLLGDAQVLRDANIELRSIREDRFGQIIASDTGGIELLLGADADLAEKAKLVAPVLAAARGRKLRAVDLRAPATPTVEFR
jgi:cell division septal protein FtsQ